MMPLDQRETGTPLPRRVDDPKCASPFCANRITIRGEFCKTCTSQQDRQREAMRLRREAGGR